MLKDVEITLWSDTVDDSSTVATTRPTDPSTIVPRMCMVCGQTLRDEEGVGLSRRVSKGKGETNEVDRLGELFAGASLPATI